MKKKSKAFTLTELLVVVVVIGVLSAVVLPKFSKVIETRRTTEAEELMARVRTEQEKRCALDKDYLMTLKDFKGIVPEAKNYKLTFVPTGVRAHRMNNKYDYTLEMPSYADGRICCDSEACQKLNKNYPTCTELKRRTDYQDSPAACAGTPPCETDPNSCECNPNQSKCCPAGTVWNGSVCKTPGPCDTDPTSCECNPNQEKCVTPSPCELDPTSCECNPKQSKCCAVGTVWNGSACVSPSDACTGPEPKREQDCNGCGKQTRAVTCNAQTGKWETGKWSVCNKTEEECGNKTCTGEPPAELLSQSCTFNNWASYEPETCQSYQTAAPVCDAATGEWKAGTWGKCAPQCEDFATQGWNDSTGECEPGRTSYLECNGGCWVAIPCSGGEPGHPGGLCDIPFPSGCRPGADGKSWLCEVRKDGKLVVWHIACSQPHTAGEDY